MLTVSIAELRPLSSKESARFVDILNRVHCKIAVIRVDFSHRGTPEWTTSEPYGPVE